MSGHQRRIIPSEELSAFQRWQFNSLLESAVEPTPISTEVVAESPELIAVNPEVTAQAEATVNPEPMQDEVNVPDSAIVANAMPYPTAEEIELIEQQAREEGYQAGLAEGRQQAEQERMQLTQLLSSVHQAQQDLDLNLADSVLELALLVAQQMIGNELREHPQQLLAPIREALAAIPAATAPSKLYLSPSDIELLQHDLQYELPADVWRILPDQSLESGSCRIETPTTQLDYSLASRWKKISRVLAGRSMPEWSGEPYSDNVFPAAPTVAVPELNITPPSSPLPLNSDVSDEPDA